MRHSVDLVRVLLTSGGDVEFDMVSEEPLDLDGRLDDVLLLLQQEIGEGLLQVVEKLLDLGVVRLVGPTFK